MTRKDYVLIAEALRNDKWRDPDFDYHTASAFDRGAYRQWGSVVLAIARALSDDSGCDLNGNRRFDRERFLSAAGFRGGGHA